MLKLTNLALLSVLLTKNINFTPASYNPSVIYRKG